MRGVGKLFPAPAAKLPRKAAAGVKLGTEATTGAGSCCGGGGGNAGGWNLVLGIRSRSNCDAFLAASVKEKMETNESKLGK